jgi:hypothetical protein
MRIKDPKNEWATPLALKQEWSKLLDLDLSFDPCPLACDLEEFNGLEVDWVDGTFCNPPYDLKGKTAFVNKAIEQLKKAIPLCCFYLLVQVQRFFTK